MAGVPFDPIKFSVTQVREIARYAVSRSRHLPDDGLRAIVAELQAAIAAIEAELNRRRKKTRQDGERD